MNIHILKRLLTYVKPQKLYLIFAVISAIISVSLSLIAPILVGQAIDLITGQGKVDFNSIIKILSILVAVIIVSSVCRYFVSYLTGIVTQKTVKKIRIDIFEKINTLPLSYVDSHPHGDIISRIINDIDAISDGLLQGMTQIFNGSVTIILTLFFMLSINVSITVIVVFLTPISIIVATLISKFSYNMFRMQSKVQGDISSYTEEMISGQKIVKAFSFEDKAIENFNKINNELYKFTFKSQFYSAISNPSTRIVNTIVYTTVGIVGALNAIINGNITIGQISCFLSYANQYTTPFNDVTSILSQIQSAFAAAIRVFNILDEKSETKDLSSDIEMKTCKGEFTFSNVSFSYDKKVPLIKNFNLSVKPGQKIAIVGPTGCGKTTLINLIMRFYDVQKGEICIDMVPIKNIKRDSYRNLFGMILQDTWLFSGTIRDNIAFGCDNATDEMIKTAAKEAFADGFIKKLDKGYDTIISGDNGVLSSGQRQLLTIARAMLKNPKVLILDEATSNIDTRTEIKIQKAFAKMMKGRTSFIVAHRLSTIKNADIILVMNNGNIIEKGTHGELLERKGFYYDLYNKSLKNDN